MAEPWGGAQGYLSYLRATPVNGLKNNYEIVIFLFIYFNRINFYIKRICFKNQIFKFKNNITFAISKSSEVQQMMCNLLGRGHDDILHFLEILPVIVSTLDDLSSSNYASIAMPIQYLDQFTIFIFNLLKILVLIIVRL